MKLFEGQKVHVMATVDDPAPDDEGHIRLLMDDDLVAYAKPENIIHAEPAPLAVGDLVTWGNGFYNYTILHIDAGVAFLKHGYGPHTMHDITDLRRAGHYRSATCSDLREEDIHADTSSTAALHYERALP